MAHRLVWSPEAVEDIVAIAAYIERDSPWYAKIVATKFIEMAEALQVLPDRGRIVPEIGNPAIRERFVYSYRIIYRVDPERVLVAAVLHGSRLLEPFLPRVIGNFGGERRDRAIARCG